MAGRGAAPVQRLEGIEMNYDNIEAVIAALDQFEPTDYEADNCGRLDELFRNFRTLSGCERALPSMFALLERFPAGEFGNPGPVVQEIEHMGGYHELLKASLARVPTAQTVWMANRIMNTITDRKLWSSWMQVLQNASSHPLADEGARASAQLFIDHQNERIET